MPAIHSVYGPMARTRPVPCSSRACGSMAMGLLAKRVAWATIARYRQTHNIAGHREISAKERWSRMLLPQNSSIGRVRLLRTSLWARIGSQGTLSERGSPMANLCRLKMTWLLKVRRDTNTKIIKKRATLKQMSLTRIANKTVECPSRITWEIAAVYLTLSRSFPTTILASYSKHQHRLKLKFWRSIEATSMAVWLLKAQLESSRPILV